MAAIGGGAGGDEPPDDEDPDIDVICFTLFFYGHGKQSNLAGSFQAAEQGNARPRIVLHSASSLSFACVRWL